jgi:hypothetical protein
LTQSAHARPILIFDGTCGFCRRWIERWQAVLGDRIEIVPYQDVLDRFPDIPAERFGEAYPDSRPFRSGFTGAWGRIAPSCFASPDGSGVRIWFHRGNA